MGPDPCTHTITRFLSDSQNADFDPKLGEADPGGLGGVPPEKNAVYDEFLWGPTPVPLIYYYQVSLRFLER
jgi:hypothetical protein